MKQQPNTNSNQPSAQNATYLKTQGDHYFHNQEYESAVICYFNATDIKPNFKEAYFNMGFCLIILNEAKQAFTAFNKAIHIDPIYAKPTYHKISYWLLNHKTDLALQAIDRYEANGGHDTVILARRNECIRQLVGV